MKKKAALPFLFVISFLLLFLSTSSAETRQGVILLEDMENPITETLYQSQDGFSFWYVSDDFRAYHGEMENTDGDIIASLYSDDYMLLSRISEDEALEYAGELHPNIAEQSEASPLHLDVSRKPLNGKVHFQALIADKGSYLLASGEYYAEAAEGTAKYFQRVMDSVTLISEYDLQFLRELPGTWTEESDGAEFSLTLGENGSMSLFCRNTERGSAFSCNGIWSYDPVPGNTGQLTLHFTSTDNPLKAGSAYSVECVYAAYTESWVEDDTLVTFLILNPPISCSGVSPFEETWGDNSASLCKKQGPNMRVVNCKSFVSLRETRSVSSKRLAKVPLGALVLAFPEAGDENGFISCVYHDQEGYILSEYLQKTE